PAHSVATLREEQALGALEQRDADAAASERGGRRQPGETSADDASAPPARHAAGRDERGAQVQAAHLLQVDRHPAFEATADVHGRTAGPVEVGKVQPHRAFVSDEARAMPAYAITGSSGYIGTRTTRRLLDADPENRVIGFDVRPPRVADPRL